MKNGKRAIIARLGALACAGAAVLLSPHRACGDELDFFPRVENVRGSLDFDMQRRDTKKTSGELVTETSLAENVEKIRLVADGYVYHPRFMLFHVGGAEGLKQSSFDAAGFHKSISGSFDEYDVQAVLLPEHPYNLSLFARRVVPPASPLSPARSVSSSRGAILSYRKLPLSLYLSASSATGQTESQSTHSDIYSAGGSYHIGPATNFASYNRTDSTTSQGTQAVQTHSGLGNNLNLGMFNLSSNAGTDQQDQSGLAAASAVSTDSFTWSEHLGAYLPLNFIANLSHEYTRGELTIGQATPSSPETAVFSKSTSDNFSLNHSLYSSLRTSYQAGRMSNESAQGDTRTSLRGLALDYTKYIPIGSLRAGCSFQDMTSTRTNTPAITSEGHSTAVPGSFNLNNQAVDPSTIIVMVKDPATQNLVTLTLNTDYQVIQFGNVLQIVVLGLPAFINPLLPSYDFLVTYNLLSNDSELEIRTTGYTIGFTLLDGLFSPYYSYFFSDQELVSGSFPGGPDRTITQSYGYIVQKMPVTLSVDYTDYQSRLSPYRRLKTSTDYREHLYEDFDVFVRLSYSQLERRTASNSPTGTDYFEKTTAVQVTAHKALPHEKLNIYFGGSYAVRKVGDASSQSYAFSPNLKWHLGRLDVTLSASKTYTIWSGTHGKASREDDAYFLTVSRKMF